MALIKKQKKTTNKIFSNIGGGGSVFGLQNNKKPKLVEAQGKNKLFKGLGAPGFLF